MATNRILTYREHYDNAIDYSETSYLSEPSYQYGFNDNQEMLCYHLHKIENKYHLKTGYYIGIDWLESRQTAICIEPKLNIYDGNSPLEIDYLGMLLSCLRHTDVNKHINNLYSIKWHEPLIQIKQKQDLLTPLLIVEYLSLLKQIVKKGLKTDYYQVSNHLQGSIKGKVLVGKTIKQNTLKNKPLKTVCAYDEIGLNNQANRLLKKALKFIKRYIPTFRNATSVADLFNYINPAFENISDHIEVHEIRHFKSSSFYKEYGKAIQLAQLILKRFGYSISNVGHQLIATPPFWIDMSKLFELYVLGLLKNRFRNQLTYHFSTRGNELDYILKSEEYKLVIDAKYKTKYQSGKDHQDIRQVSGYARLSKVYQHLELTYPTDTIQCLIVYPDQVSGLESLLDVNLLENPIEDYEGMYRLAVKLPVL